MLDSEPNLLPHLRSSRILGAAIAEKYWAEFSLCVTFPPTHPNPDTSLFSIWDHMPFNQRQSSVNFTLKLPILQTTLSPYPNTIWLRHCYCSCHSTYIPLCNHEHCCCCDCELPNHVRADMHKTRTLHTAHQWRETTQHVNNLCLSALSASLFSLPLRP